MSSSTSVKFNINATWKKKLEWKGPIFIEKSFKEGERGGIVWGNWWVRLRDTDGGVNLQFKRDKEMT